MRTEYRRDLQNNYLIIEVEQEQGGDSYCLHMAEQNEIPGLLTFHSARKDGKLLLHYDITAKQPLEQVFAKKMMNSEELLLILGGICSVLDTLQKYLLNPTQLLFDPQYIFVGSDRKQLLMCYLPDNAQEGDVALLAEFLLKKLNHADRSAVDIGYRFYQETLEENFSLRKTLKELLSEEHREEEKFSAEKIPEPKISLTVEADEPVEEFYEVEHKVRKKSPDKKQENNPKKEKAADRIFRMVHPAVLLSGLVLLIGLELLFYFGFVNVTEAGGIFFLLLSGEILINQYWKQSKEKKQEQKESWVTEEDREEFRILREEMYQEPVQEEEMEETRCLMQPEEQKKVRLVCVSGENGSKRNYPDILIGREDVIIGKRKGESDVVLDSPTVSRMHARLETDSGRFYVRDLNSKNGTFWNGQKLRPQESREISAGDTVAFAEVEYLVYFARNQ